MTIKRNPFARLLSVVMLLSLCCLFTACPSDPDDKDNSGDSSFNASFNIQELTSRKWKSTDVSSGQAKNNDLHIWFDVDTYYIYFKSDKTGAFTAVLKDYDTVLGNTTRQEYILFDYTVNGNVIITEDESGNITKYTYMDDYLLDGSGTMYIPVTISAGDYEYLSSIGPKKGSCGGGLTYSFDERTHELVISGSGPMSDYTSSNQPWHDFAINKVTIKDGCTYIGAHAFHGLKYYFTELSLPNSIQEIGNQAFSGTLISSLSMPTSIVKIGYGAFSGCKGLKSVNFSGCNNLEVIDDYAFQSCPINLSYFTLPNNVKAIGIEAFFSASVTNLTLNDKLETVGDRAFSSVKASKLVIPNSVKSIGNMAFLGSFSEIRIGTGLKSLGIVPFQGAYKGSMYVNLPQPLPLQAGTIYKYFISNSAGDNASPSWTLYVPKGCKAAYQSAHGWNTFKSIVEDASLSESSSGSNDNSGSGTGTVSYTSCPDNNHPHAIDLGLPSGTKWACCNVGASKPEDYGDYYAWGETEPKSEYSWDTYKYGRSSSDVDIIGTDIAGTRYDAATANWGAPWHMPTWEQIKELLDNTTSEWTTLNGVYGCMFMGKNGRTIFLPAARWRINSSLGIPPEGCYWSSTHVRSYPFSAYFLDFSSGSVLWEENSLIIGQSVRPVR